MSSKFELSNNDELIALVRKITDNKISRGLGEESIADLSDFNVMSLPEAAVITICDGYYYHKLVGKIDNDQEIFKLLMKARQYNFIEKMKTKTSSPSNLYAFMYNDLCLVKAQQYLTLDDMRGLEEKYKKIKGISDI